jgi:tetratricopeptide (TPR) repeat protein
MVLKRSEDFYYLNEIVREECYKLIDDPAVLHKKIGDWYLSQKQLTQDVLEGIYHLVMAGEVARVKDLMTKEALGEGFDLVEGGYSAALIDILKSIPERALKENDAWCIYCVEILAYAILQKWEQAEGLATKLEEIAASNAGPNISANLFKTLGQYHAYKGEFSRAESLFLKSCELFRALGENASLASLYMQLARLYFAEGEPIKSMRYVELEAGISGKTKN